MVEQGAHGLTVCPLSCMAVGVVGVLFPSLSVFLGYDCRGLGVMFFTL
jgi:hypothetical protein